MSEENGKLSGFMRMLSRRIWDSFFRVPLLGWLIGILIAVMLEHLLGDSLVDVLGLSKIPALFGFVIILKNPILMPGATLYVLLIYIIPVSAVARISSWPANKLAARLLDFPIWFSVVIHLGLFYAALHM